MSKRNEKSYAAEKLYLNGMKLIDIAKELDVPEGTIRRWKYTQKWGGERSGNKQGERSGQKKKKRGGQPGNKNATGPPGNQNARKHGLFSKYLPADTLAIIEEMPLEPLDMLWDQIQISYAAIIRAQQIMYVEDKKDDSVDTTGRFDNGNTYQVQKSWDKQASFMAAQAKVQAELRGQIKQYDEMIHKNWNLASNEQKARVELIRAQVEKTQGSNQISTEDKVAKLFDTIGGVLDES